MAVDLARALDDSGQLLSSPMAHSVAAYGARGAGRADDGRRHLAGRRAGVAATATSRPGCG